MLYKTRQSRHVCIKFSHARMTGLGGKNGSVQARAARLPLPTPFHASGGDTSHPNQNNPIKNPLDSEHGIYRFGEGQLASGPPSIGRRIFCTLTRFSIAVLIGVGATLGLQSYGDAAKEMLVARAPTLAWVLSVSTTKSPVVAATSTDPMQQLAPLASNLDVVRRSVEQLAAKQEQMAQNIAALRPRPSRRPLSRSINPSNPGRSHRLRSLRRYPARRPLPDQMYSRADGADCRDLLKS
jgi:hypothetical protein